MFKVFKLMFNLVFVAFEPFAPFCPCTKKALAWPLVVPKFTAGISLVANPLL